MRRKSLAAVIGKKRGSGTGVRIRQRRRAKAFPKKKQDSHKVRTTQNVEEYSTRVATWYSVHTELGRGDSFLPLSAEKLTAVTEEFKVRGYRSLPNYLTAIKRAHLEANFPWTELLEHTMKACRHAGKRGLGRGKTAKSFTWLKLKKAYNISLAQLDVERPAHVSSISSHLLFRAEEVGTLNCNDVCIKKGGQESGQKWRASCIYNVSHSKTDAEARGCRLRLRCT